VESSYAHGKKIEQCTHTVAAFRIFETRASKSVGHVDKFAARVAMASDDATTLSLVVSWVGQKVLTRPSGTASL
jgi:hypothetical protein